MGLTHVTTTVRDVSKRKGKSFTGEFLVDTGAIHCLAPASDLKKAGIRVEGRGAYTPADGAQREFEFGFARVEFMGSVTVAQIIFGPEGAEPILGVVAIENTGIIVDPSSQSLRRLHAIPLK